MTRNNEYLANGHFGFGNVINFLKEGKACRRSGYHKPAETNISLIFYPEEEAFFIFLYAQEISETPIRYIHQLQHFLFGLGLNHEMEV